MCCPGCRAVASLIADSGMTEFYRFRSGYNLRPDASALPESAPSGLTARYRVYDEAGAAADFSQLQADGSCRARLLLGGVTCAACTWLIEQSLAQTDGVITASVNLAQSRLDVHFDPARLPLSAIFAQVEALGYRPHPLLANAQRELLAREYREDLRRLAVAGLGMMQVGMFAIALHAGDLQGIAAEYRGLMRWVSLIISSFVVLYAARGFFSTAWRHLRQGNLVMDLPVALAIGLAWLASIWATVTASGQVYFDSVVMFTFFLLLGRFLERRVRRRYQLDWYDVAQSLPAAVSVWRDGQWVTAPRVQLQAGDRVLVPAGSTLPIDGTIIDGKSAVREDSFTGEELPRIVASGDDVFAGTLNLESALQVTASGSYRESRLEALQQSLAATGSAKPRLALLADRVAGWFVLGILLVTAGTAAVWTQLDPERVFWISLSVLVISCPCALALATPAALASAATFLRRKGILVHGDNALDALARGNQVVFDKTGTLTEGRLELVRLVPLADLPEADLWDLAAGLQRASRHPVARVFDQHDTALDPEGLEAVVGAGVRGHLDMEYRMGSERFSRELAPTLPAAPEDALYWVALVRRDEPLAWFGFKDRVREAAAPLVATFAGAGLATEILSGDTPARVADLARGLNIKTWQGSLSPEAKVARVQALQDAGQVVIAVGDGLNDAPLLARANASFAVAEATDLARAQADFVIQRGELPSVSLTWDCARRCRRVVRQNLTWALCYNVSAIPLAAMGFVPPWLAALGMSASSLLVVLNSLRLARDTGGA